MNQHEAYAEKKHSNDEKHRLRGRKKKKAIGKDGDNEAEAQCIEPADSWDDSVYKTTDNDGTYAESRENKADDQITVVEEEISVNPEIGEVSDNKDTFGQQNKIDGEAPPVSK